MGIVGNSPDCSSSKEVNDFSSEIRPKIQLPSPQICNGQDDYCIDYSYKEDNNILHCNSEFNLQFRFSPTSVFDKRSAYIYRLSANHSSTGFASSPVIFSKSPIVSSTCLCASSNWSLPMEIQTLKLFEVP
jgi:hypothetical protein